MVVAGLRGRLRRPSAALGAAPHHRPSGSGAASHLPSWWVPVEMPGLGATAAMMGGAARHLRMGGGADRGGRRAARRRRRPSAPAPRSGRGGRRWTACCWRWRPRTSTRGATASGWPPCRWRWVGRWASRAGAARPRDGGVAPRHRQARRRPEPVAQAGPPVARRVPPGAGAQHGGGRGPRRHRLPGTAIPIMVEHHRHFDGTPYGDGARCRERPRRRRAGGAAAPGEDPGGGGRLRRHDHPPPVPAGAHPSVRLPRAAALCRHPVRPCRGRGPDRVVHPIGRGRSTPAVSSRTRWRDGTPKGR